jgi:hypothetical protein
MPLSSLMMLCFFMGEGAFLFIFQFICFYRPFRSESQFGTVFNPNRVVVAVKRVFVFLLNLFMYRCFMRLKGLFPVVLRRKYPEKPILSPKR